MDEHQGTVSRVLREVQNLPARSFTPECDDPQGTQHPTENQPHEQTWENENPGLATMGRQLQAFAQANHTHMRAVRGGRQARTRFAADCRGMPGRGRRHLPIGVDEGELFSKQNTREMDRAPE